MSAAAISAAAMRCRTMADGSLRIEVEVEPADAQTAFAMFGRPGAPMALAALKVGHARVGDDELPVPPPAPAPAKATKAPKPEAADRPDHALSKWCAIRCGESDFWDWIESCGMPAGWKRNKEQAAEWVRWKCKVASRAEFDTDPVAAERFHRLIRGPYSKYCLAMGMSA